MSESPKKPRRVMTLPRLFLLMTLITAVALGAVKLLINHGPNGIQVFLVRHDPSLSDREKLIFFGENTHPYQFKRYFNELMFGDRGAMPLDRDGKIDLLAELISYAAEEGSGTIHTFLDLELYIEYWARGFLAEGHEIILDVFSKAIEESDAESVTFLLDTNFATSLSMDYDAVDRTIYDTAIEIAMETGDHAVLDILILNGLGRDLTRRENVEILVKIIENKVEFSKLKRTAEPPLRGPDKQEPHHRYRIQFVIKSNDPSNIIYKRTILQLEMIVPLVEAGLGPDSEDLLRLIAGPQYSVEVVLRGKDGKPISDATFTKIYLDFKLLMKYSNHGYSNEVLEAIDVLEEYSEDPKQLSRLQGLRNYIHSKGRRAPNASSRPDSEVPDPRVVDAPKRLRRSSNMNPRSLLDSFFDNALPNFPMTPPRYRSELLEGLENLLDPIAEGDDEFGPSRGADLPELPRTDDPEGSPTRGSEPSSRAGDGRNGSGTGSR